MQVSHKIDLILYPVYQNNSYTCSNENEKKRPLVPFHTIVLKKTNTTKTKKCHEHNIYL